MHTAANIDPSSNAGKSVHGSPEDLLVELVGRIEAEFGIQVVAGRRGRLRDALNGRLAALGNVTFQAYLTRLEASASEWRYLLPAVCVGESHFFRDRNRWSALSEQLMPRILASADSQGVRIWSAGCAAGHEAYSIAAVCDALHDRYPDVGIEVVGHDIDDEALAAARTGRYDRYALRGLCDADRHRLFNQNDHVFQVREAIRRRVRFEHGNLVAWSRQPAITAQYDLILCQNVVIYFSDVATRQVVAALGRALKPGGYLIMGHSEVMTPPLGLTMETVGDSYCFHKPPGPPHPGHEVPAGSSVNDQERIASAWDRAVREDFTGAEKALDATMKCLPARLVRAWISYCRHDWASASRLAHRCLAEQREQAEPYYILGLVAEAKGDKGAAIKQFEKAARLDTGFAVAHFHLAELMHQAGRRQQALDGWRQAERAAAGDRTRVFRFFGGFDVPAFTQVCRSRRLGV